MAKEKECKRGVLSMEERDYIIQNHSVMSLEELCTALNRNKEPILKYMKENGLNHIEMSFTDDEKRRMKLRKALEKKYWYKNIEAQLINDSTCNEMDIFVNKWIDMYIQFREDVLSTEEFQMNELILLSINLERVRKQEILNIKKINDLKIKIDREYDRDETVRDIIALQRWEQELQMAISSSQSYITQIKNINHDVNNLNKDLKATRDKRFEIVESDNKTFLGIIRTLQDEKKRNYMSRETELMKLAAEKERERLYDFHTYGDNTVDIPVLNSESAAKLKDSE